jgi:hypothetical protein
VKDALHPPATKQPVDVTSTRAGLVGNAAFEAALNGGEKHGVTHMNFASVLLATVGQ